MSTERTGKPRRTPRCVPVNDNTHEARPLVKIAPKVPPWQSLPRIQARGRAVPKSKLQRRCPVPGCHIGGCRLQTHRAWKPPTPSTSTSSGGTTPQRAAEETGNTLPPTALQASDVYDHVILRGGVDGMPYLPLASMRQPIFRSLFHNFILEVWDRIAILLTPPARSSLEVGQMNRLKSRMLTEAMEAPAYLLNFIATTYLYRIVREDHTAAPGKDFFHLQVELVKHLRWKLDNFTTDDVDQLMCVVLTLVMMEISWTRSQQTLLSHRQAMVHLVESRGGLHNLGRTVPYAMNMDRIIALYTDQAPIYCAWVDPTLGQQRAPRHPRLYGCFFEDDIRARLIHPDIIWYTSTVCRAIEILEGEDWYFLPGQIHDSSELWYFYFVRDQVVCNYAHLNARFCHENSITRCTMLAAKIVDYSVLMDGFVVALLLSFADRLRHLLCHQNLDEQWEHMSDVLRWVLWVLIIYPGKWAGHTWALRLAKERLDLEYGTVWPSSWTNLELLNVRQFVWSNRRAGHNFTRACNELWKLSAGGFSPVEVFEGGMSSEYIHEVDDLRYALACT